MTNEDFKYKIINASPERLVIVTYEIILDRLDTAEMFLEQGNLQGFRSKINNAKEFVSELICSLKMNSPVSAKLADLYILVNRFLTKAYFLNCGERVELKAANEAKKLVLAAKGIVERLMKSLGAEVDDRHGVCAEACQIYTGVAGLSVRRAYRKY